MSRKNSRWKSLKNPLRKSPALYCKICGKEAFALLPTEDSNELALECQSCYTGYVLKGERLWIGHQSGKKNIKTERWDWSKTDWIST